MYRPFCLACLLLLAATPLRADGPKDNHPEEVRQVPKPGIEVPDEQRQQLELQLAELKKNVDSLRQKKNPQTAELLPDVEIFYRAVQDAFVYQEFFSPNDIKSAFSLLEEGQRRATLLAQGKAPWTSETGLVVRGYRSKLDDTVQPYGLVIPETYRFDGAHRHRVDLWFHGRGETLSEVNFIAGRRKSRGQFAPQDTIVLHPYGRYSNANKFAGEIDALEALESVKSRYRVDDDRVSVRGFSMGGASTWQMAVHYPGRWFAANPGAGFSETPEFLKFFQKETLNPTWYEKKLWHMYDCTDWAVNLFHCPTVAYSGEIDIQKQAADIMEQALEKQGIDLVHVIGPKTAHRYHPDAAVRVEALMDALAVRGRQRTPHAIHFTTYTLRYNQVAWLTIDGLGEHWEAARVDGKLEGDEDWITLNTQNVTALTLELATGECPFDIGRPVRVSINGFAVDGPLPRSDRSWKMQLHLADGRWQPGAAPASGLAKRHGLQGPIDDALLDSFLFVAPSGKSTNEAVATWAHGELDHAVQEWRRQFRGHARVKTDTEVNDEDIAQHNLILWGDPASNSLIKQVLGKLPIQWTGETLNVAGKKYDARQHVPLLIYPNPLNPDRYVVLNSSFTYREFAYLNNARQVPKLPDWAVVDVRTPPDSLWPGKVVAADFFDEAWKFKKQGAGSGE